MTSALTNAEYRFIGSGGGGGGSRPQDAPNTLRSASRVQILYAMAAGEIAGLGPEPMKRIYLDNQPIQNPDGTFNHKDVSIDYRTGTNFQTAIPGFTDIASEYQVGVKLTASGGTINRTLSDENADAVVIRLSVPALQRFDDKDGAVGTKVDFSIGMSVDGGPTYQVCVDSFEGKSSGPYEQSYRIPLYKPGRDYKISLTRITPDTNSSKIQDELIWQTYTSIIDAALTYPNVATISLGVNAEQFNNVPPLAVDLGGWVCDVPDNYDPDTRIYTGIWSGNFKRAYTNNPAWMFYYLCKDDINGCGQHIDANQLDKAAFYQIGRYCDELIPDGFGGLEPRFVCTAYIETADDAYNVLNTLASTFRGMVYWANGLITATQDAPQNFTRFYGEENTIQEVDDQGSITKPNFNYSGSGSKARHTVVLVTYLDKNDFHKQKVEVVEDLAAISRYGYHETTVTAFGCDSRGQAKRVGLWLLYTENQETEVISFGVPSDGMLARPGEIVRTIDPIRSGRRQTGRVTGIEGNTATLDVKWSDVSAVSRFSTISFINSVDAKQLTFVIDEIYENPKGYAVVSIFRGWAVGGTFDSQTLINTPWMIQTLDIVGESWRVFGASEEAKNQYTISGTRHNPSKYGAIERGLALDVIPTSIVGDLTKPPQPPSAILSNESFYESRSAGLRIRLDLSWTASPSAQIDLYRVDYQRIGTNAAYTTMPESRSTFIRLDDFVPGIYLFRVQAINRLGLRSEYTESVIEVYGKTAPPNAPTNFIGVAVDNQLKLRWDESIDLDVRVGGQFLIKFTPKVSGTSWSDGFDLDYVSGAATSYTTVNEYGTYMIKAIDSTDNASLNHTSFVSDPVSRVGVNTIQTIIEDSLYTGTKTNVIVSNGLLQLAPNTFWDSLNGNIDALPGLIDTLSAGTFDGILGNVDSMSALWDGESSANNVLNGVYEFGSTLDLGAIYSTRLTPLISAINTNTNTYFDSLPGTVDTMLDTWDVSAPERASVYLEIAKSNDGVSFGSWQRFLPGDYQGRAFKFRAIFTSTSPVSNVLVDQMRVAVTMNDRVERGRGTSFSTVYFAAPFRAPPTITPTIVDPLIGESIRAVSVTPDGFIVHITDSNQNSIIKQFDWVASGYGIRY